jgi:hypothetical protein
MYSCCALEFLATLGTVARVLRSLWLLLVALAIVMARRRIGRAFQGKFTWGVIPTVAWRNAIPTEYWPAVSLLMVRLRVLLGLLVISEALWLSVPLVERTICARCPCRTPISGR